MIIITGSVQTNFDNRDEIRATCAEHSARSRSEPGCISHNVHIDCEQPDRLFFYEQWEDEAAVATHFRVSASRKFVTRLTALAGYRPEMHIFKADEVSPDQL
ncbi:putative quinol monooxygenase [Parasphingorhabdus sp.]|uniref:putative quinol monooxygenase n=1 Tax=Parasphingorhabdus sp. TaxID=2709688 RepID=UPI003264FCF0